MIARRQKLAVAAGLALGLETAGSACATLSEEARIDYADVVVDGLAICDVERGRCRLRVTEAIKEDGRRRTGSSSYLLRFEPRAGERLARHAAETGELLMCVYPWRPARRRVEGRFYLSRVGGSYWVGQDSARGDEAPRRSGEPAE